MKTKTLTKNLVIAIILATVCIASFALSLIHFNASAETMYLVNYVDNAGRLIKTETTSLGNLSGADKEGHTVNYSVVHSTVTALPFQKINLKEPILYYHANGGYSLVGGDKELLDWYDINQPESSWEAEAFQDNLLKEWGYNQYVITYEYDSALSIRFYLDKKLDLKVGIPDSPVIKIMLDDKLYELTGQSHEGSEYGLSFQKDTYGGLTGRLSVYDYGQYNSIQIVELGGITPESYETAKALNEITAEDAIDGVITVRANYTAIEVAEPTPTPNEPTTDGDNKPTTDKPNAFVSFFKDNANTLKTQFTALGNADFNTALTTGWQIYAVLGSGLIVLIAIITSILSALRPRKRRRR